MTFLEALENRDQYFRPDIGVKTQQVMAYAAAALALVGAVFAIGSYGIVIAVLFLCATVWPAAVGRVIAMLTIVFSAIIIAMGDTTASNLIRPMMALATIPLIFVSMVLASERFAELIGVSFMYGVRKIFRRGSVGV